MEAKDLVKIGKELRERQEKKAKRQRGQGSGGRLAEPPLYREIETQAEQSYEKLDGEWLEWLEVAKRYEHKVPSQDRLDIRHDIILELHRARQRDKKPLPLLRAYRIASLVVALYWRKEKRIPTILSLDEPIAESDEILLRDTVADDSAINLDAWLDAEAFQLGCPMRLIEVATKRANGIPLNKNDQKYLERIVKRERGRYQKTLF